MKTPMRKSDMAATQSLARHYERNVAALEELNKSPLYQAFSCELEAKAV
jgi:hypothetical protein